MAMISVVTGTYNRCSSLIRMVKSVRKAIPRKLKYEIVVVDGGSFDSTVEWCKEQKDIVLIEHGKLLGAIKAFCDGAKAASGEYVVLSNDDIEFFPESILAAYSHLQTHPSCGAVAFADNRTSLLTGDGKEYRTEGAGATLSNGIKTMVTYAQVGMFRKEIGDYLGWWGSDDPIMGKARTYGGDNYLSARIWEMGLTVDPVPLAKIQDKIERDVLRDINGSTGRNDSKAYYDRFPTINIPSNKISVPAEEEFRILYLPIYESGHPAEKNLEYGMADSLERYGTVLELDYLNTDYDIISVVEAFQPHLMLTQIQGTGRKLTPYIMARCRQVASSMVVVNWNGDAHEQGLLSKGVVDILKFIDIQTVVNAKVLPIYKRLGIRAAYWQIPYKDPIEIIKKVPKYDVLFQGNCYDERRTAIYTFLRSLGYKVGIYGNCQGADGNTHYSFAHQSALYSSAKITIGDTYPDTYGFVSNRFFQSLSAGAFLLQQRSEGLDDYNGTRVGVHYIEWTDLEDLRKKIDYYLSPSRDVERHRVANEGRAYIRRNFSHDAQVDKLFNDILPLLQQ